ncbi:unnamed protein product [Lupinus luteus]|uniref:Uncharacterized protein n=1 Tax=Lupinus luteus TaxID=3873 RepID=A0AAV1XKP2_LUPLU
MMMSIIKMSFILVFIFASYICNYSEARGPIFQIPCHSDLDCERRYGPSCKCINTNCCPTPPFDKIHIQTSKE